MTAVVTRTLIALAMLAYAFWARDTNGTLAVVLAAWGGAGLGADVNAGMYRWARQGGHVQ